MREYPDAAVQRAREGALDWLTERKEGHPRSREQEDANTKSRGAELYDDLEAPPILGYEQLEREGLVRRVGVIDDEGGQRRIHFKLNPEERQ